MVKTKKNKEKVKLAWDAFDKMITVDLSLEENEPNPKLKSEQELDICKSCGELLYVTEEGFLGCVNNKCGVMDLNMVDQSPEWRFYGSEDNNNSDPTRCGMPINPLLKESSFGCKVICNRGSNNYEMRKISRFTNWHSMPYREKAQYDEFQHISNLANIAGISKLIIDDSLRYHKTISELKTFRGENRDAIIASSVYISCRKNKNPRTPKEIASIFYLNNSSATKGCKNAVQILKSHENEIGTIEKIDLHETKPSDFIDRYCSKLNINKELTMVCKFAATKIYEEHLIPENNPQSLASGIIYFISNLCNLNISKKQIKIIGGTSEVTINKCNKRLEELKDRIIPSIILTKYAKNYQKI